MEEELATQTLNTYYLDSILQPYLEEIEEISSETTESTPQL